VSRPEGRSLEAVRVVQPHVRLGQGEVQRYAWFVGGTSFDRATPRLYGDLERFLADLRVGGTMGDPADAPSRCR